MPSFRNALLASLLSGGAVSADARPLAPSLLDAPSIQDGDQLLVDSLVRDTRHVLSDLGIAGRVDGRVKSPHSVHAKMRRKGVGYDEIYDRLALRVRVATVDECYAVMARLESLHRPIEAERDDYIADPKANGYRSLHSAVRTALGDVVEFQVRTHEMHAMAEHGAAAHALYKLSA